MIGGIGNDYSMQNIAKLIKSEGLSSSGMSNGQNSQQNNQSSPDYVYHIGERTESDKSSLYAYADAKAKHDSAQRSKADAGDKLSLSPEAEKEVQALKQRDAGDKLSLSPEAEKEIQGLKQRDAEVRAHEQKHIAASGGHSSGAPSYTYVKGPDNKQYVAGGSVSIDTSPIAGDPEATIKKAEIVRKAALAPGNPSAQDKSIAASASAMASEARIELRELKIEEGKTDEVKSSSASSSLQAYAGMDNSLKTDSGNKNNSEGYLNSNGMNQKPRANLVAATYQNVQNQSAMLGNIVPWGTNVNMVV